MVQAQKLKFMYRRLFNCKYKFVLEAKDMNVIKIILAYYIAMLPQSLIVFNQLQFCVSKY